VGSRKAACLGRRPQERPRADEDGVLWSALGHRERLAVAVLHDGAGDPTTRALKQEAHERAATFFRAEFAAAVERGEVRDDVDLDVAARLVATLAGPGLIDALSAQLGKSLAQIARSRAPIADSIVRETVLAAVKMLAGGLGTEKKRAKR